MYDKGKGAVIIWRMDVTTEVGEPLARAEHSIFYVGAGGFGGDPGPKAEALEPPVGKDPDFTESYYIPRNQAALYRLNGDLNPLHVDPDFAKRGGVSPPNSARPLHLRLCSEGRSEKSL